MTELSPSLFQRIVEEMPEAVIVSDRAGAIVYWNRAAEMMFGHSAGEAMGQSLDLIIPTLPRPSLGRLPDGDVDRRYPLRSRVARSSGDPEGWQS